MCAVAVSISSAMCSGAATGAQGRLSFTEAHIRRTPAFGILKSIAERSWTIFLATFGASVETISAWEGGILERPAPAARPSDPVVALRTQSAKAIPTAKAASIARASSPSSSKAESPAQAGIRIIAHTVAKGDTLSSIAARHSVSVDTITWGSGLSNPNKLKIGQVLKFPSITGVIHSVAKGETIWSIAKKYGVSRDEIARANALSDPDHLQLKQSLVIPDGKPQASSKQPVMLASRGSSGSRSIPASSGSGVLLWPVSGRISSPFGWRWGRLHTGIDIAVPIGTSVAAAADGRVSFVGTCAGYGKLVILDHGNGMQTYYAHNSSIAVKEGERVEAGERIAKSGNSGNSRGPHVHFEVRVGGKPVNPSKHLR